MTRLVKDGGRKSKSKGFFPWPYADEREEELILEVVKSRLWWRMSGEKVEQFERAFADMLGVKHCIGVTNGTHAIELALSALDIKAGDEVIVPGFTFISTLTAIIYCNAVPVIVDVDPETYCIDPQSVKAAISSRTKAIIPVHMAGHCCDMDELCEIAKAHNLFIVEDAAHAHGAEWKGRKAGSFGDFAIFSFQNGKLMTCGEGGAVVTNNDKLYQQAYLIHGVGRPKGDIKYEHLILGSNDRMNEFQGAILIAQLERLSAHNEKREEQAKQLDEMISEIKGIRPQGQRPEVTKNSHYMYMFYYDKEFFNGISRNEFVKLLNMEGIPAFRAYPTICDTEFFKEMNFRGYSCEAVDIPVHPLDHSRSISDHVVWLPHYTLLGDQHDLIEICNAIKKIQIYAKDRSSYFEEL